ncbi:MAG TPA: Na/Pi cotransporter [Saprospirales bacterium]|jgi:phosphate:Na+ symporter|nr:Na/Pi cotransporter family protein [Saprospiraceae bacterium]HAW05307.1 Na/Pi cotransporter [Saprospirales bacterium]
MEFGFWDVLQIIGALAFFVYGMKMMSDGIQRAAGSQLRNILRSMTKNRFLGVGTGFLTTALVQSSSATTVMTVSFVNAGLLTLVESAGIMMGANIGTTITGWIVSLLGFKMKLSAYSIPLFAIGVPMLFSKRGKFKYWGEFIIGFAILFLGLTYLKGAVPDLKGNTDALAWIQSIADYGFFSRVLFVFVGALVTVVVQSSSAAMAITLTLVYTGWLPLEVAAAMILGENIGTTITAEIASLVGNTNAKRSARIHSLFNIIGVTWMIILLPWILGMLGGFVDSFRDVFESGIKIKQEGLDNANIINTYKLAAFHTTFNIMNVLIMLPFVSWLVKMAIKTVPEKAGADDEHRLKFISAGLLTPELATVELQKETAHFGEVASRMSAFASELINSTDSKKQEKIYKKIFKYEEITDKMEIEITEYITKLSNSEITPRTSVKLRSILNICNDLERIGDIYYQISKTLESKNENNQYFTPEQRNNLNEMSQLIDQAFAIMNKNLATNHYDEVNKDDAMEIERDINKYRNNLRKNNLSSLGVDGYDVQSAMIYNNIFSSLEKVGDHIINVTEAVVGEV